MFKEFMGLPVHALVVHAAVVLVPLQALFAVAFGVLPRFRDKVGWAAVLLAVVAPASTFVTKESGEELEKVLEAKNYPATILSQVAEHEDYADVLFWLTLALAAVTCLLVFVTSRHPRARSLPSWVGLLLTGAVVVLALFAAGYVYLTGHSGAKAVWTGIL